MAYQQIKDLIESNLVSGSEILAVKHREVEIALLDFIQASQPQVGDIKRIKSDIAYLQDNFEINGLGKNIRLGWAICNGNNGTEDFAGKVGIGYGVGYSTLGGTGGSKDAVIVEHSHTLFFNEYFTGLTANPGYSGGSNNYTQNQNKATSTVGVSGIDKNMQPYIINLYIMKI